MIVCKPKVGTLFSILVFSLPLLGSAVYGFYVLWTSKVSWYHYLCILGFGPLALGLLLRQVIGYKIIGIGKDKLTISFLLKKGSVSHSFRKLHSWKETSIKTPTGNYRQLEMFFEEKTKVVISMQEHTNYPQVVKYLKKKHKNKFVSGND